MPATILRTRGGVLDVQDRSSFAQLSDRIATERPYLLIHLHGGLVSQADAEAAAERLSGSGAGAYGAPSEWEQVYVVWRTGALETLRHNWRDLADNDRLYRVLVKRLISLVSKRIGADLTGMRGGGAGVGLTPTEVEQRLYGGSDAPFADIDQATSSPRAGSRSADVEPYSDADLGLELELDTDLQAVAADIEASLGAAQPGVGRTGAGAGGDPIVGTSVLSRLDRGVRARLAATPNGAVSRSVFAGEILRRLVEHGVSIGKGVLTRYRSGRDHGLHATVAEEIARELYGDLIGSIVWGMMKGDAREHFLPGGFGADLAKSLAANPDARVMIVAHSAGAIFASELLLHLGQQDLPVKVDLVFLAAAVRTSKFAQALEVSKDRIASFRAFLMLDEWERKNAVLGGGLGFIYPSSLLYLVSGLFEEAAAEGLADAPLVGMARFLDAGSGWLDDQGEGVALAAVQEFLRAEKGRCVLAKADGGAGLGCGAIAHGDFDNEALTLASIMHFLRLPWP